MIERNFLRRNFTLEQCRVIWNQVDAAEIDCMRERRPVTWCSRVLNGVITWPLA